MGGARQELERLRSVYETGVLRLLLRQNSMLYVALLRSAFQPLTEELPRETLEDRLAQGIRELAGAGEYALRDGSTPSDAAHQMLAELSREGDGDYAWLANSLDVVSHRFLYRLTARAHRAIDALSRLEDDSRTLSGAQANSIIMEVEHARMMLTADPRKRIGLLEREIEDRRHEIERIRQGESSETLSERQVEDVIGVLHNTLRGVPVDLKELALSERDNGDVLRRRMQSGSMSVEDILSMYHDDYRRSFHESDSGRRFNDAFQVIVTEEGRKQIDDAIRDIAKTPYLAGESGVLLNQIRSELARIYEGIEDVRRQMRLSDEAISRLVRQRTDMRYRTMLGTLNRLFAAVNDDARRHPDDEDTPYRTEVSTVRLGRLPLRPARPLRHVVPPELSDDEGPAGGAPVPDLKAMVDSGGPRLRHMLELILQAPVMRGDDVDMAASFNLLPSGERRESELIGFLGALPVEDGRYVTWNCVASDGTERPWRTRPLTATMRDLEKIMEEERA